MYKTIYEGVLIKWFSFWKIVYAFITITVSIPLLLDYHSLDGIIRPVVNAYKIYKCSYYEI
jgi:hypothetical protein